MATTSEQKLTVSAVCDGKGWIKNPDNPTGFFSCRGCSACGQATPPAPRAAIPTAPERKMKIFLVNDDGERQLLEVPVEEEGPKVYLPTPAELRAQRLPEPEAMHGAADEFSGEDYPAPEDFGASPHDLGPDPTPTAPSIEYRAPDALPGQLQLVRVPHTLEEVEAAGGYPVIYSDPPWAYVQQGRGVAENHYKTMSIDEIKALPVGRLASKNAVLFLWGTWPQLPVVLETMEAWGFTFKTCGFVWVKHHEGSGKECVGGGFWTRANSEFCLIGVRGKHPKRIDKTVRQLVQAPRGEHSAKPAEVRERIHKLMGDLPSIELFARERVEFMDAWGLEVPGGSDVIL